MSHKYNVAWRALAVSIVTASWILVSPANAVTYSTSGLSQPFTNIGGTVGQLFVLGSHGNLDVGTINLNYLLFNAINVGLPNSGTYSISETMTVDNGSPEQLVIPFNLNVNRTDSLTIVGGTTISFLTGGSLWQIIVDGLTLTTPGPGGTVGGWLTASVTDPPAGGVSQAPLPAALPLFASGLGAMGVFSWWKRRKSLARNC